MNDSDRLLEASTDIATLRGQVTELADALVAAALWLSYDGNTLRGDGAIHNSRTDTRLIFGSHRSQDLAEDYFRISKSWRELVEQIETSAVAEKYRPAPAPAPAPAPICPLVAPKRGPKR